MASSEWAGLWYVELQYEQMQEGGVSFSSLSPHCSHTFPLNFHPSVAVRYIVLDLWAIWSCDICCKVGSPSQLPAFRPVFQHGAARLVSVVSTLSTKCLKLNRAVIHLEVQRSAVCGQLSGGAHSLIVQPSNVPHYVVFYVQYKLEQDMGVDVSLGAFPLVLVH